jgi:hypothetical protein
MSGPNGCQGRARDPLRPRMNNSDPRCNLSTVQYHGRPPPLPSNTCASRRHLPSQCRRRIGTISSWSNCQVNLRSTSIGNLLPTPAVQGVVQRCGTVRTSSITVEQPQKILRLHGPVQSQAGGDSVLARRSSGSLLPRLALCLVRSYRRILASPSSTKNAKARRRLAAGRGKEDPPCARVPTIHARNLTWLQNEHDYFGELPLHINVALAHGLPSVHYPHSFMTLAHRDQRNTNQSPKPRTKQNQLLQLACSFGRSAHTVYPHFRFSPMPRICSPVWVKGRRKLRENEQLPKSAIARWERGKPHMQVYQQIIEENDRYANAHDRKDSRCRFLAYK